MAVSAWFVVALATTLCIGATTISAFAQSDEPRATGNNLYEACTGPEGTAHLGCNGYILGVADALMALPAYTGKTVICLPNGYNTQQLDDVALKYLTLHPEQRATNAAVLVISAFIEAFPC